MDFGGVLYALIGVAALLFVGAIYIFALYALARGLVSGLARLAESVRNLSKNRRARRAELAYAARQEAQRADLEDRFLLFRHPAGGAEITSSAVSGGRFFTGHADGTVAVRGLSDPGKTSNVFGSGCEAGVYRLAASSDGRFLLANGRGAQEATVFGSGGEPLGKVSLSGSEAFASWDWTADDAGGYLLLDVWLEDAAFCDDPGEARLAALWSLSYGPDGAPGPIFGSAAFLARVYAVSDEGPRLLREYVRAQSSSRRFRARLTPGGAFVISGFPGGLEVLDLRSGVAGKVFGRTSARRSPPRPAGGGSSKPAPESRKVSRSGVRPRRRRSSPSKVREVLSGR